MDAALLCVCLLECTQRYRSTWTLFKPVLVLEGGINFKCICIFVIQFKRVIIYISLWFYSFSLGFTTHGWSNHKRIKDYLLTVMLFLNLLIFLWNKKGEFHNICFMNKSIMSCQAPKMTRTTPTICIKVVHVTCVLYFKSSEILGEFYVRKTVLNSRIIVLIWFYSMNCLKNKTLTRGKDYHKIMTNLFAAVQTEKVEIQ